MAERQPLHKLNPGSVVRQADRLERKASHSTERAARELAAIDHTIGAVDIMIYTYEECVAAIEQHAQEKAEHE